MTEVPGLLQEANITDVYGELSSIPCSLQRPACGSPTPPRPAACDLLLLLPAPPPAVAGLALDYCVQFTAAHLVEDGYRTSVVLDGTRAVDAATGDLAVSILELKGVTMVNSTDLLEG